MEQVSNLKGDSSVIQKKVNDDSLIRAVVC
jgi:hypothetical protein